MRGFFLVVLVFLCVFCFAFILVGCFALGFALVVCSKGSRNDFLHNMLLCF